MKIMNGATARDAHAGALGSQYRRMCNMDDVPNFRETALDDLWRYREEHSESEHYHKERRHAADQELLRRAAELDAQILDTAWGPITIVYSSDYHYDTAAIDRELAPLVERDHLQREWNQF